MRQILAVTFLLGLLVVIAMIAIGGASLFVAPDIGEQPVVVATPSGGMAGDAAAARPDDRSAKATDILKLMRWLADAAGRLKLG
jgi:hypothetical protein